MIHKQLTSERVAFCALACRIRLARISAESAPPENRQKQQQHKRESLQVFKIAFSQLRTCSLRALASSVGAFRGYRTSVPPRKCKAFPERL